MKKPPFNINNLYHKTVQEGEDFICYCYFYTPKTSKIASNLKYLGYLPEAKHKKTSFPFPWFQANQKKGTSCWITFWNDFQSEHHFITIV